MLVSPNDTRGYTWFTNSILSNITSAILDVSSPWYPHTQPEGPFIGRHTRDSALALDIYPSFRARSQVEPVLHINRQHATMPAHCTHCRMLAPLLSIQYSLWSDGNNTGCGTEVTNHELLHSPVICSLFCEGIGVDLCR